MRTVVAYGGGTNSAAMLCGMYEAEEMPDFILFADTGGEKPYTYRHIDLFMQPWLLARGFPTITYVRLKKPGGPETLEQQCLRLKQLPSIAYGYKTCSQRYKIEPQDKYVRDEATSSTEQFTKCIGYDVDEERRYRGKPTEIGRYRLRYPLVERGWGRDDCVDAIQRHGLPQPGKSACFFCPSSRKAEISWLRDNERGLYDRALAIESTARDGTGFKTVKGLGRHFSWASMDDGPDAPMEIPCDCYDGEPD